ncbi:hypothetical protein INP49_21025 [Xanthomonas perforans]|nr:hypothetical protein [Xanthomonas perforans]
MQSLRQHAGLVEQLLRKIVAGLLNGRACGQPAQYFAYFAQKAVAEAGNR